MASKKVESLDTNVILRAYINDIPEQFEKAVRLLERKDVVYVVSDAVLSEVVFVLTRMEVDRETIVGLLMKFTSRPNIKVSDLMGIELFLLYLEHSALSFTDCYLVVESAMNNSAPLWTFDKVLAKELETAKLV